MAEEMTVELRSEHRWLQRFVGEWTYEHEATAAAGEVVRAAGRERVRSLGGAWIVCEGSGEMPGGGTAETVMMLGYDAARACFVGSFAGSMMSNLWVYEGAFDDAGDRVVLHTEGPSFTEEGATGRYRDTFELRDDDHRVMTSSHLAEDGTWHQFMTAHYRRVR